MQRESVSLSSEAERVVAANVLVHATMADSYGSEPHWRPENQAKVDDRLASLLPDGRRERALDVGCGSGFLTTKLAQHFSAVDGVDVTQEMLEHMPITKNISTQIARAESLPFDDSTFDMVTAYSFLHHLHDPAIVLKEMARVLRPGGRIYIDLEPNRAYWDGLENIESNSKLSSKDRSSIVNREIAATLHIEEIVYESFGIDPNVFIAAEYSKSVTHGFDCNEVKEVLEDLGFADVEVNLDWFMGQGVVMHAQGFDESYAVLKHLQDLRPASDSLFKYLWLSGELEFE